jgi:DTW domain-containing protein
MERPASPGGSGGELLARRMRKQALRCRQCGLLKESCVCALAPRLDIRTRFIIVSHAKEMQRASNTARLARLAMPGTKILLRGVKDRPIPPEAFAREGAEMFVLFPSKEAREINEAFVRGRNRDEKPFVIVVPDGSWNQSASAIRREAGLKDMPRLKLPPGPESRYALRSQSVPGRVSTFEAMARVVGIVEGGEKQQALEAFLDEMVRRSLTDSGKRRRLKQMG